MLARLGPYVGDALVPTNEEAGDNFPSVANMKVRYEINHALLDAEVSFFVRGLALGTDCH